MNKLRSVGPLDLASDSPPPITRRAPGQLGLALAAPTWSPLHIATDHCKGCSLCIAACAKGALAIDESRVNLLGYHPIELIDPQVCTSCALCARVCPDCVFTVFAPPKVSR